MLIHWKVANDSPFSFNKAYLSEIEKELRLLNPKKACIIKNITPKILKENREYCSDILQEPFNNTLSNKEFPDKLKCADVTTIYKKGDPITLKTTDLSVYCLKSQTFLRKSCILK